MDGFSGWNPRDYWLFRLSRSFAKPSESLVEASEFFQKMQPIGGEASAGIFDNGWKRLRKKGLNNVLMLRPGRYVLLLPASPANCTSITFGISVFFKADRDSIPWKFHFWPTPSACLAPLPPIPDPGRRIPRPFGKAA